MNNHILIIEDEKNLSFFIKTSLEKEGFSVSVAYNKADAREKIKDQFPDLLLLDLNLPDGNGLDLYTELKEKDQTIPCIVITAHGSIPSAIEAMKKGVDDYVSKPFDLKEVLIIMKNLLERYHLKNQLNYYRRMAQCNRDQEFFISELPMILELQQMARKVAEVPASTMLIEGATGTGKEMFARYIHNNSDQADAPFVEINCASLPDNLLESELFGYEPGAFTGAQKRKIGLIELADNGTLFLDEIAEMTTALQAKLLRFIENLSFKRLGGIKDIKVKIRIIAATNKNVEELVRERKFREDLFYRLNLFRFVLPTLEQRKEEILLIAQFLLEKIAARLNKRITYLSPECEDIIYNYKWPGNIRELNNVFERAIILAVNDPIIPEHFPKDIRENNESDLVYQPKLADLHKRSLREYLNNMEKSILKQALDRSKGNQIKAASLINEPRHILRYLIKKHPF
jgi:DNA-binding NtrC family response regulator